MRSEEGRVCTPMKTTLAVVVKGCRLCFTIVSLARVGAVLCELPLCIPHEPHVSGSRAGYYVREGYQLTKLPARISNSQKKHVLLAPRCSHGLGLLPRVVARFCELMLHVSFTSLTEVRVVRERGRGQLTHKTLKVYKNSTTHGKTPTSSNLMTPVPVPTPPARRGACSRTRSS